MRRKKKILFISHTSEPTGAPISLLNLLKYKPKDIYLDLNVVSMVGGDLEKEFSKICPTVSFSDYPGNTLFDKLYIKMKGAYKLILYLNRYKPDIVFINSLANFRAITISKFFKYKVFVFVREYDEMFNRLTFLRKKAVLLADKVFVPTQNHKKWVIDLGYKGDIEVIPNGIDLEFIKKSMREINNLPKDFQAFLQNNKGRYVIANIGKMSFRKGWDLFLEIIRYFQNRGNMCFLIIGDFERKEDREIFEKEIKKMNIKDRVHITGMIENIFPLLKYVDVLAFTSRKEVFPRTVLECGVVGIPIIAFKSPDLEEIFPEGYQYFVEPYNINSFCGKLEKLLYDNMEKKKISEVLMEKFERYDIKKISQDFFEKICKKL